MLEIKDGFIYIPSIEGTRVFCLEEQDSVSITPELIDDAKIADRYIVSEGKFRKDNSGDWYCQTIHYEKNEKKFWEVWKPDEIPNRIVMVKRRV